MTSLVRVKLPTIKYEVIFKRSEIGDIKKFVYKVMNVLGCICCVQQDLDSDSCYWHNENPFEIPSLMK